MLAQIGEHPLRWIDNKSFTGPDRRRQRPRLRHGERRQEMAAGAPLSLAAALRQLRVHCVSAKQPTGVRQFATRVRAVADLASAHREDALARELKRLADRVDAEPMADWSAVLLDALHVISERYDTVS